MSFFSRSSRSSTLLAERLLSSFVLLAAFPAAPNRVSATLHRPVADDGQTVRLSGHVRPVIANGEALDLGAAAGSRAMPRLSLHFAMTPPQRADLAQLLKDQQDRRSPLYRRFLTPEQFAARFGRSEAEIETVSQWLEKNGFRNLQVARSRAWVSFSGTVGQTESAFHPAIHNYSLAGEPHLANATDPQLPKALQGIVQTVGGLHDFQWRPHLIRVEPLFSKPGQTNNHWTAPDDWQTIYNVKPLYGLGLDGTGVAIAVVGQSNVQLSDIRTFRSNSGLPAKDPTVITPPGYPAPGLPTGNGDETESDLDLEWAGAIAKNADILFVTTSTVGANGVTDSLAYAIDSNIAPIISLSYGGCEADVSTAFVNNQANLFMQAAAQGITIVAASGDTGAASCDSGSATVATQGLAVDYPASSPYVTGVGGTSFVSNSSYWNPTNNANGGSALSYIPENAWNEGFGLASGGGISKIFAKPSWQTGPGVPSDGQRDVPDIAFTAAVYIAPLLICGHNACPGGGFGSNSTLEAAGGTSASTPPFAGILALAIQSSGSRLGNINSNLYSLAQISNTAFHDVVNGNNRTACQAGSPDCSTPLIGYLATPGYDQVTGWGSVDAFNFVEQWFGDIQVTVNPAQLTIQPGSSAVATVNVSPQNNFTGKISFSCAVSSSLYDVTCSVPSTTVDTSGSTTVTITAATTAHAPSPRKVFKLPLWTGWLGVFGCLLAAAWILRRRRVLSVRSMYAWSFASSITLLGFAISCGGGASSGSNSKAYPALALSCSFPTGTVGSAYSGSCAASGGNSVYSYSAISNDAPRGLTLNASTGAITGVPTSAGPYQYTITVTDTESPSQSATQSVSFVVNNAVALSLVCNVPWLGRVGSSFGQSCYPTGGTPPFSYSLSSGVLPAGLILNSSSGSVSGTPSVAGTTSFTMKTTDGGVPPQTATFPINVTVQPPLPLSMFCAVIFGQARVPAYGLCNATGGVSPYYFAITAGALPSGISLTPQGSFTGTPTVPGPYSFSVTATDTESSPQTATASYSGTIGPPPTETGTVTVTAKSGGIVNTATIAVTVPMKSTP